MKNALLFAFVAALGCLSSSAATPSAVWNRSFAGNYSANYTLDANGNSVVDDGDYLAITKNAASNYEGGVKFDVANDVATQTSATIIFKVMDLPRDTEAFLISMHNKLNGGNGLNDPRGVYIDEENRPRPIIGGNKDTSKAAGSELPDRSGERTFAFTWSTSTMALYEVLDSSTVTNLYSLNTTTSFTFGGCTIGAEKAKSNTGLIQCATGLKITGVAIFNGSVLTTDEIAAYAFPYGREGTLYSYVFTNTTDCVWETMANWRRAEEKIPYGLTTPVYQPAAFDGILMNHQTVTATDIEGYQFKLGLYNGAEINVAAINKFQAGGWLRIDETSKATFSSWGSRAGSMGGTMAFHVAGEDGLVFGMDTKSGTYTYEYYLKGKGSVQFNGVVNAGTHTIAAAQISLGDTNVVNGVKVLRRQKLVGYNSASITFGTSSATVTAPGSDVAPAPSTVPLSSDSNVGDYVFDQTAKGLYLNYVDIVDPKTSVSVDLAFSLTANGNTMAVNGTATCVDGSTTSWTTNWTATSDNSARGTGDGVRLNGPATTDFFGYFNKTPELKDGVVHPSVNVKMTPSGGTNGGATDGTEWWWMVLDVELPDALASAKFTSILPEIFLCNRSGDTQTANLQYRLIDCDLALIEGGTTNATSVLTSEMGYALRNTNTAAIVATPGKSFQLYLKAQAHTGNNGFFSGIDGITLSQNLELLAAAYEATITGDTSWNDLPWTKSSDGSAVTLPEDISRVNLTIHGAGRVTGLAAAPLALTLDTGVFCDVTAATSTTFAGGGCFLYRASALTSAKTLGSDHVYGVIAYDEAGETASGALSISSTPFYSYGNVTLSSATFSGSGATVNVPAEIWIESGNLTLMSLPNRGVRVAPGATVTVGADATINSGNASGYYGNGTFAVAAGKTVDGGYLGVSAKYAYSGDAAKRMQLVNTDHGTVGAGATLKFTTMTNRLDAGLMDFLGRFTIADTGAIKIYAYGASEPYATLPNTSVTADDYPFETAASIMGYATTFNEEMKLANVGYDTSFISALVDADGLVVTNTPASGTFAASLYADISGATGTEILTLGDPSTCALRLVVDGSVLNLVAVANGTVRKLGVIAAKSPGFHLYTIVRSGSSTALYVDGAVKGIDYSIAGTIAGDFRVGAGVSVRMARVDAANLSAGAVAKLAQSWPAITNTTAQVSSTWANAHLPKDVVAPIFRADPLPTKDEIQAYMDALNALAKNRRSYLENYLLGIDPDGEVAKNHAFINEVKFSADPVDFAHTNATVLLEYANPASHTGINVTYRLAARKNTGVATRDVPVTNGVATIRTLCATNRTTTAYKAKTEISPRLPNVIFVLADDLGYGDVGWTVQNARKAAGQCYISTPNMDQMVAEGCQMTAHYAAAPVCAPSRASLLTGRDQGHCSLRDNCFDYPILEENTIGTLMRSAGYATYAIGKWGVGGGGESGLPAIARPLDRGFDHYYGFLDHGAGHTYYHYDGLVNGAYMGVVEDREHRTDTAVGIYSTDLFTARAKKVIKEQTEAHPDQPFFMYLAINAIHGSNGTFLDSSVPNKVNLHVPGRAYPDANPATDKKYGLGEGADWDWLQTNREDVASRNTWKYPYTANYDSDVKKRYATGITRLDEAMADLKQTLIDLGIATNTLVIFTSDNGPTNEYGTNVDYFDSNGAFSGMKRSVKEGGLREPTFLWWPGHIPAGSVDDRPSMNSSWYSFLEQLVKSNAPGQLPEDVYSEYKYGSEQVMVRIGDYVGLNTGVTAGLTFDTMPLNVYNVVTDPGESTALTDDQLPAGLRDRMRALMKSYHTLWTRSDGVGNGDGQKSLTDHRPYDN